MQLTTQLKQSITKLLLVGFVCSTLILPAVTPLLASEITDVNNPNPRGPNGTNQVSMINGSPVAFDAEANKARAEQEAKVQATSIGCEFKNFGENMFAACSATFAYYLLLVPANTIASIAGLVFNYTFQKLVIGMGSVVTDLNDGIFLTWQTLRDIANVFLVFITIYIGIATILGISGYGDKKLLWKVLVAALLVNFSITFTKLVIDVSNIASISIFTQFEKDIAKTNPELAKASCASKTTTTLDSKGAIDDPCINHGIAAAFWTKLKITTIFNIDAMKKNMPDGTKSSEISWAMFFNAIMGAVLFTIMAFVFGSAAFLLIGRFVVLIFLIVVSPVALVAWITGMNAMGKKWWSMLISQSFFAPLILLFWWISYKIVGTYADTITKTNSSLSFADSGGGAIRGANIDNLSIIILFGVASAFLILSLTVAKQLGAHGSNFVLSKGKGMAYGLASGMKGGAALAGGYALGKTSQYAQRRYTESVANAQEKSAADGKSRFLNRIGGTRVDRWFNAGIGAGANAKLGLKTSFNERQDKNRKANSERQEGINVARKRESIREAMKVINAENADTTSEAYIKAQKTISSAAQADVEHIRTTHRGESDTQAMRNTYSKKQATELAKKGDATPAQKAGLTQAAHRKEIDALRSAKTANVNAEGISKITMDDVKNISKDLETNPDAVKHLSQKVFNEIMENKDEMYDKTTLDSFRTTRDNYFLTLAEDKIKEVIAKTKGADFAENSKDFLSREEFLRNIDTKILSDMYSQGEKLTKEKRDAIKQQVESLHNTIPHQNQNGRRVYGQNLTQEQKNIVSLYQWLNNNGRFSV